VSEELKVIATRRKAGLEYFLLEIILALFISTE
jgi:hypothetical protein